MLEQKAVGTELRNALPRTVIFFMIRYCDLFQSVLQQVSFAPLRNSLSGAYHFQAPTTGIILDLTIGFKFIMLFPPPVPEFLLTPQWLALTPQLVELEQP